MFFFVCLYFSVAIKDSGCKAVKYWRKIIMLWFWMITVRTLDMSYYFYFYALNTSHATIPTALFI